MVQHFNATTKTLVVSGRSQNGVTQTMTDPNYVDFKDRMSGALLYRQGRIIETCENEQQRIGWQDERDDTKGFAAYLRCLERENLPASWADKYVPGPAIEVEW